MLAMRADENDGLAPYQTQLLATGPANKNRNKGACNGRSHVAGETVEENRANVKSRPGSHYRCPAYRSNQSSKQ